MRLRKAAIVVVILILSAMAIHAGVGTPAAIVETNTLDGFESLVDELASMGIDAAPYYGFGDEEGEYQDPEDYAAIWLGSRVPLDLAVKVIKTAWKHFPFLKYISITREGRGDPEEMLSEVFIGGSTSTALEEGCKPIFAGNFAQVSGGFRTLADLHAYIDRCNGSTGLPPNERSGE